MSFLDAQGMVAGYGGEPIIRGCNLRVERGQIHVIVGPNGAGKSTAMKAVFGMMPLEQGSVFFDGHDITSVNPRDRVELGMAFVPQTNNIFVTMTVAENLDMGAFLRRDDYTETIEQIYQISPILYKKRDQLAGELSGGQRQQLAVARALMTNPSLLMLDEPTAGVSPIVMNELFNRIVAIRDTGVAVLMVEQNARKALEIADLGYVLVAGENRFTDNGKALIANPEVRQSFLGG